MSLKYAHAMLGRERENKKIRKIRKGSGMASGCAHGRARPVCIPRSFLIFLIFLFSLSSRNCADGV